MGRRLGLLGALVAMTFAAGCGEREPASAAKPSANPGPAEAAVPQGPPAYAQVFPGAAVSSRVTGTNGGGVGGMVAYTTKASPEEVLDFYRKAAKAAGLAATADTLDGQLHTFVAGAPGGGEAMSVSIVPNPGGGSLVQLIYG